MVLGAFRLADRVRRGLHATTLPTGGADWQAGLARSLIAKPSYFSSRCKAPS